MNRFTFVVMVCGLFVGVVGAAPPVISFEEPRKPSDLRFGVKSPSRQESLSDDLGAERFYPPYTPLLPEGAKRYSGDGWTQEIFQYTGGARIIRPFPVSQMADTRWNQPGGMEGVKGWKVERYKTLPGGKEVVHFRGGISVKNSLDHFQTETGIRREYPVGARFDEVLLIATTSKVFEHRVREKTKSGWVSRVEYADESSRPAGYTGLKVSCASCHQKSGTGAYADGLVPGGDTVMSDPLDLSLANATYDPALIRR